VSSLPPTLVRFESQLEQAIRRDRSRRSRLRVLRVAVAGAAAVAVALGVLSTLPGEKPSLVERAAAGFALDDDTIFHYEMVGRQTNPDGSVVTWRDEGWQDRSEPFARRSIETGPEGVSVETASVGERTELYDPQTNTIYASPETKAGGPVGAPKPGETKPPAARSGKADASAASAGDSYRAKILGLLDAGRLRDAGWVSVAGERAIRLASDDGSVTLLVEPGTYQPIEWRVTENGTTAVARFPTYDRLPANDTSAALLSLRAQHPDATVDASPGAYEAARQRLAVEVR
jgi:hypothetical protein